MLQTYSVSVCLVARHPRTLMSDTRSTIVSSQRLAIGTRRYTVYSVHVRYACRGTGTGTDIVGHSVYIPVYTVPCTCSRSGTGTGTAYHIVRDRDPRGPRPQNHRPQKFALLSIRAVALGAGLFQRCGGAAAQPAHRLPKARCAPKLSNAAHRSSAVTCPVAQRCPDATGLLFVVPNLSTAQIQPCARLMMHHARGRRAR